MRPDREGERAIPQNSAPRIIRWPRLAISNRLITLRRVNVWPSPDPVTGGASGDYPWLSLGGTGRCARRLIAVVSYFWRRVKHIQIQCSFRSIPGAGLFKIWVGSVL